ncbi:MAG: hypothetical protein JST90_09945 [Bacteroidetes bacterium]|nr:hypothetical protein [Bacteroidota bacterium]
MKRMLFALLLTVIAACASAQEGVYLTYADFKDNKMIPADPGSIHYDYGHKAYVWMKQGGEKKTWKMADIWGFKYEDKTFRCTHSDEKDPLAVVMLQGNFVYYVFEIVVYHAGLASGGMGYGNGGRDHYYISKDLESPVYFFTAHLETLEELVEKHPEFKPLNPFLKKAKDRSELVVQDCIKASPEYKTTKQLTPKD